MSLSENLNIDKANSLLTSSNSSITHTYNGAELIYRRRSLTVPALQSTDMLSLHFKGIIRNLTSFGLN